MKFLNWGYFTSKTFSTSRNQTHGSGKSPHVGMDPKSFHKKSNLHIAPFNPHRTSFGSSPLSPLNPWYNSYFPSRNNW